MKIGELSERTGVPTRMLRYYEDQGLLHSERSANGYRSYGEDAVARAIEVRGLITSGLSSRLVKAVLEMRAHCGETRAEACSLDFARALLDELVQLETRIQCLTASRDTVLGFLERSPHAALVDETRRTLRARLP
ncbi:MerR family DNA-binding transcriptional regulator [Okibacterium endophyticum]